MTVVSTQERLFPGTHTTWSPDRRYRYFLRRPWEEQLGLGLLENQQDGEARAPIAFVLLNPSTADERKDDPTVARCRRYGLAWGFGEVIILNAFAYRATDPKDMRVQNDPVGPENDATLLATVATVLDMGGRVVCGWGNHGAHLQRSDHLRAILAPFGALRCFPKTKAGEPGHPLYLRKDVTLEDL